MSDPVTGIGLDREAFAAFYRAHLEAVERFIARRVDEPYLAADLTAEVFLAAIEAAEQYDARRGAPGAWLHGIARNVVADEIRRRAREKRALQAVGGRRELAPDAMTRIEARIDAERASRTLYAALAELPESDRAIVELIAVDGMSVADAARALGLKPGNARVRLHRSRSRIQSALGPRAFDVLGALQ